ncbi:MAG: hypothetical protein ACYC1I_11930 [Acidimicrobiales bacterium]
MNNIDKIIAGPDPIANDSTLRGAEKEATYAKVMARVAGRRATSPRVRRRVFAGTGVFATAAAAVTMVAVSFGSVGPATSIAGAAVLNHLVAHIKANATTSSLGDATLVLRTQSYPNGTSSSEADLYADNGEYFSTPSESGLPAAIAANANIGNRFSAREIQAALDAANGNLATAVQEMATAPFENGVKPANTGANLSLLKRRIDAQTNLTSAQKAALIQKTVGEANSPRGQQASTDNYIWMDSMDALVEGAGNPDVRIGVLRILSTLSEVAVTSTTTNGQPTITLTATAPALPSNYQEAITINASTGVPVSFTGGTSGQTPSVTVTYQVSRVTMANIAAGNL